jgi:hypothetical protein
VVVGALLNAVYEADGRVDGRVLFLLDEAARLGPMAALEAARDAVRARMELLDAELVADRHAGEQLAGELRACAQQEVQVQARLKARGEEEPAA